MQRFPGRSLILILVCILIFSFQVGAGKSDYVDPNIPESWFEAPKKASEMGITTFKQSPMLDKRVASGELPPLTERLPEDPIVVKPYGNVGNYGGTIQCWGSSLDGFSLDGAVSQYGFTPVQPTPDGSGVIPWIVEGWEYSPDFKQFTLYLRKGLKWSNGDEFTADDYVFWWKDYVKNNELSLTNPADWNPPISDVTKNSKYSVTFHLGKSYPNIHKDFLQQSFVSKVNEVLGPADFLKKFNPHYTSTTALEKMAEKAGLDDWKQYYQMIQESALHPEYEHQIPVMTPWIAVERTETTLVFERNPYFPFVDTEGNQLPYIDKMVVNLASNDKMVEMKAMTGESTIEFSYGTAKNIPMYKSNEKKENYSTFIYNQATTAWPGIHVNMSHDNKTLRKIFQDDRFRKALSLAIDREKINKNFFFGQARPMQATVDILNEFYREEYEQVYADFDPQRAEKLLDNMGMKDIDGDGFRETPEGKKFKPGLLHYDAYFIGSVPMVESILASWRNIGLKIELESVGPSLYWSKVGSGKFDLHNHPIDNMIPRMGSDSIGKFLAPIAQSACSPWPAWVNWYSSGGEAGKEPPAEFKTLIDLADKYLYTIDPEESRKAMEKLVEAQAKNIWVIGTVGYPPKPVIVKDKLKNVPVKGILTWNLTDEVLFRPFQFYFEE